MNSKNIGKALNFKLNDWLKYIDDEEIKNVIKENAIITGGALVSLLQGEQPNDYDVYFKNYGACLKVAQYYAKKWNAEKLTQVFVIDDTELFDFYKANKLYLYDWMYAQDAGGSRESYNRSVLIGNPSLQSEIDKLVNDTSRQKRITCFVRSAGIAAEDGESGIDDDTEPQEETEPDTSETEEEQKEEKPKYRPRYFSSNAISLSDRIQLVIRFYGEVEEIHTNYDFVHCTCSYDFQENKVNLPTRALESIINKELYYTGSKYPLCSIIRSRKFIMRGWHINAGQYLKMCLQLNELDLKDFKVFKDQLAGVDSAYFEQAINLIMKRQEAEPDFKVDNTYLFEIINRIF
ncbi:MAG: hypothetical protein E6593_17575 [Clostridium sp.]|nr:hypothetical protein [Clostridium sp.]